MGNEKTISRIIPDGELNCIWVDAGLISYKLCDRNFECGECPFDQVMRQSSRTSDPPAPSGSKTVVEQDAGEKKLTGHDGLVALMDSVFAPSFVGHLPDDRKYSRNHVWAKKMDQKIHRLGIDHFVASFLEGVWSIILPQWGTSTSQGNPLAWIIYGDGTLAIKSPIAGKVSRINMALKDSPSSMVNDPYDSGWICELAIEEQSVSSRELLGASPAEDDYVKQIGELKNSIIAELGRSLSPGLTLFDGGTSPKNLRDIAGPQAFFGYLQRLLSARA